jgi:hypothetical protein
MLTTAELFGPFHSPRKHRRQTPARTPQELESLFGSCLPPGLLSQTDEGPNSRERVYSVRVTFWTFLWQVLTPGAPCRSAVRKIMAWFARLGLPKVSQDDSPYCQARQRLDRPTLVRALHASAQAAEQRACQPWRFHGREVIVGDGTTSSAPDTKANQRAFPQSANQAPGCGFPLIKWVALFSLASGALLEVQLGNKHQSELALFRKIWDRLKAGMIYLADRGFCDFFSLAQLRQRDVDTVLRLNAARPADFRFGKRLGPHDRLVQWLKPSVKPATATKKLWQPLPKQITVRLVRYPVSIPGFRPRFIILATTLLDPLAYPAADLAGLYLRRWRVELFLRDIKTTLQLEVLSCKTPAMLYRELLMHLIGYNFNRALMAEAASIHYVALERISFKGTLDTVRHFSLEIAKTRSRRERCQLINEMLAALAADPVPDRPHRIEPRNRKRRPKEFPVLVKPRRLWKAELLKGNKCKNKRP